MSNKMCGVLLVLLALTVDIDPSSAVCTTTCTRGELCKGDGCEECPDGYFQDKPKHQLLTCKLWSKKPPNEHWVKLGNGTSTSDIVWGCEEGYRVHEYALGEFECQSVPLSTPRPPSTTMSSTTETSTPLMESTTIPSGTVEDESGIGTVEIIGIVIAIVIVVIIIIIVCVCLKKKGLMCFATTSRHESCENSHFHEDVCVDGPTDNLPSQLIPTVCGNGPTDNLSSQLIPTVCGNGPSDNLSSQLIPLQTTPADQGRERKYESLVKQLGADETKKLLHYLEKDNFDVDNALSFNRERHFDPEKYHALTVLDWENKHPDLDHRECIKSALDKIGRGDLYSKIFPDLPNNGQSESPGINRTGRRHVPADAATDSTERHRLLKDEEDGPSRKDVVPGDISHLTSATHTEPKSFTEGQSDDSSDRTELKHVTARNSDSSNEQAEPKSATAGEQVEPTSAMVANPTAEQIKKPKIVNLFPLYYLLVDQLGPDDFTTLLYRLPSTNTTFNAKTSLRFKELSRKNPKTCFVETLSEWKEKNNIDDKSVIKLLKDNLTEMPRNDVLESEEFKKCISDIGC